MDEECCPECGHMLSMSRIACPFCSWSNDSNGAGDGFETDDLESDNSSIDLDDLEPDSSLNK